MITFQKDAVCEQGKRVIAGVYSQTPQGGCVWCHSSWKLPSATQTKHAVPDLCGYISRAGNVRSSGVCVWSELLWFGEWPWEDTLISSWRCNVSFISSQVQWTLVWTGDHGGTFPTDYMKGREGRGRGAADVTPSLKNTQVGMPLNLTCCFYNVMKFIVVHF